jgi:hypothetical protein
MKKNLEKSLAECILTVLKTKNKKKNREPLLPVFRTDKSFAATGLARQRK